MRNEETQSKCFEDLLLWADLAACGTIGSAIVLAWGITSKSIGAIIGGAAGTLGFGAGLAVCGFFARREYNLENGEENRPLLEPKASTRSV